MILFLNGIIFASAFAATVFFLDSWKRTKDRLFLFFAFSFALLGVERLALTFLFSGKEYSVYLIRLVAFILILIAIIQKNRPNRK